MSWVRLTWVPLLFILLAPSAEAQESTLVFDDSEEEGEGSLGELNLGIWLNPGNNFLTFESQASDADNGTSYQGFEVEVAKELVFNELGRHNAIITIVRLPDLQSRIDALNSGEVDFVIGSFYVTPAREEEVTFIRPSYYSGGAALFTVNGQVPAGVKSWADLKGKQVAIAKGFYKEAVEELNSYGIQLVEVTTANEASAAVTKGAVGLVDTSTNDHSKRGLFMVEELPLIKELPISIAVAKNSNNTFLTEELGEAMQMMFVGNENASILALEARAREISGMRLPPNPRLRELAMAIDEPSLLWPQDGPALSPPTSPPSLTKPGASPPPLAAYSGSSPGNCPLVVNGVTTNYEHCYDVGTTSVPAKLYFNIADGMVKVGINGTTLGWLAFALGESGMIGSDAIFALPDTSSPSGAIPKSATLGGYTPSQFQELNGAFSDAQAEKSASGKQVFLSFSMPWPEGADSIKFRYVFGRANKSSGKFTDLSAHSSPPPLRILHADGSIECAQC